MLVHKKDVHSDIGYILVGVDAILVILILLETSDTLLTQTFNGITKLLLVLLLLIPGERGDFRDENSLGERAQY